VCTLGEAEVICLGCALGTMALTLTGLYFALCKARP